MKTAISFLSIIFLIITTFAPLESKSQSGTLKTQSGFLVFYSSENDSLNFTIRLDEPNSEIPYWINSNYLQLLEDVFYIQIIEKKSIIENSNSVGDNLYILQKWETDYIKSTMKPSVKRSAFINDNNSIKFNLDKLEYNAWYYSVELSQDKLYLYFFDIYKNGYYIRITFTGTLNTARLFIPAVLKGVKFYNKLINISKLQTALKNGQYNYLE